MVAQDNLSLPQVSLKSIQKLRGSDFMEGYCIDRIFYDSKGRMWLQACSATKNNYLINMVNYDGYSYTPYDLNLPKEHRLDKINMIYLLEDDSFFGIINSPEREGRLIQKKIGEKEVEIYDSRFQKIENILRKNENEFWISTIRDSFFVINNFNLERKEWNALDSFPYNKIIDYEKLDPRFFGTQAITFDDKYMLIGLSNELYIYDEKKKEGKLYYQEQVANAVHFENERRPANNHNLSKSGNDTYLIKIGYTPPLFKWNAAKNQFVPTRKSSEIRFGESIFTDQQGNTLFTYRLGQGKKKRAYLVDSKGDIWEYSKILEQVEGNKVHGAISSNFLKEVFIVNERGLFKAEVQYNNQSNTYYDGQSMRWLSRISKNELLVKRQGTSPVILNLTTKEEFPFSLPDCVASFFNKEKEKDIRKVIKDPNGNSWLLLTNGIVSFSNKTNEKCNIHRFETDLGKASFSKDGHVYYLAEDDGQIFKYDLKLKKSTPCQVNGENLKLGPRQINYLFADQKGRIWVASNHSLFMFDPFKNTLKQYGLTDDFSDFRNLTLHEDSKGRIWIGTVKGGIQIFNPETEQVEKIIDNNDGLSNNAVVSIIEDKDGYHWVGTYDGLNAINEKDEIQFRLFEEDGLPDNEFNRWSFCTFSDDKLFMGTVGGLFEFNPNEIKAHFAELAPHQIYVSQIGYYDPTKDQTIQEAYPNLNEVIILEADQRFLEIKAGMTNFANAKGNTYAYKIEGSKKDWITIGSQHKFSLSNLPSGKFSILINGIDHLGNRATKPVRIQVFAKTFFYQQTWFILSAIFSVLGIIGWWIWYLSRERVRLDREVKFRTKQIQDDKELIEEQAHQLLKMDELKTNFFNNISHEIRTPVTLIAAPMKNVLRQHSEEFSEEVKESLDLVHRNAQKLGGLVEELLEISKLDAGTQELYTTPTLLFDYLEQLFLPYQAGAKLKKIDYQFDYPLDKKLCLQIDQKRLSKVINNLLSNAIKFTPNGGIIVLSVEKVEKEQTFICISVKDNGRGIPEKDLPYIFDRHFQSSKKTVPKEGGAGIGLALAKELTTLMKGEISVESTFGKGSLFKVLLPKEMADKEQKTSIDLEEVVVPIVEKKEVIYAKNNSLPKVLIVEDNPDMQLLIRSTLSEQYHCITANDGQEAWEWFDQKAARVQDVQLIVSDIMMPRMDGHELLAKLKAHDEWSKLPIVMLTARSSKDAKLKALRLGVDDYLLKPFSSEELQIRVQNLLQNYQKRTVFKEEEKLQVDFEEVNSDDQNWLAEIEKAALDALEKSIELNAIYLSSTMMISERQLLRKLKSLTGLSIKKYIQEIKLQKARHLLESKVYQTVAEVAYASGFSTPSYLTKLYNSRFGKRPSAYLVKN